MVRGNMLRLAVALSGVALVVNGCKCDDPTPPVTCADAVVSFEQPMANATVDAPFDVSIVARTADGAAFDFESASLKIGSATFDGQVSGNRATFTGVTAAAGAQELSAAIAQGSCSQTGKQTVTVRSTSCTTPAVTAVSFPQDADSNGVLNATELPGAIQVRVAATCVSGVQVRIKRGSMEVGPLTSFMSSVAVVTLNDTNPANDTYEFTAELVRDGQVVGDTNNPAARQSIRVARTAAPVSITTSGTFGPNDDASMTAGFQLDIVGSAPDGLTCSLTMNGETKSGLTPAGNEVSAQFTLPASSGMQSIDLRCTDVNGNVSEAMGSITLDFTAPTVTTNVGPAVVTDSPLAVVVNAPDAEDGSLVVASINGITVATGTISMGSATVQVPFGSDGSYTIEFTVTDTSGNAGTTTAMVTVDLTGCGLVFTRPATASALLTPAQLTNGTYSFQTRSDPLCANAVATLFRSDLLVDGGVGPEQSVGTATLSSTGTADFAPLMMTTGDYRYRGQVANPNDAGVSFAIVNVVVDLDGPSITNPIVPTGQTSALITAAQDTSASTPGVQRTLAFSARTPMGGRVDVCISQSTDASGQTLPGSPECGTGWYVLRQGVTSPSSGFTFPEGAYNMKIVVVGSGLTPAPASAPVALTVDGTRPCVQGISRSLPQDTNGDGRLNIAELAGGQPQLQFSLGCGDATSAALAAMNGVVVRDIVSGAAGAVRASTVAFASGVATVTLTGPYSTEQDLNLFVELTDLIGNKNLLAAMNDPATFTFRVDPVAPTCVVTSPAQSTLNIAQVPGGNLAVDIATAADVGANGVSVTFTGQTARSLTPALNTASTTYALTGDATYTIGAICTDQSGNATTAQNRVTRVDLVAPTCAISTPAAGAVFTDNEVVTTVDVSGVAAGTLVTVASSVNGVTNNTLTVNAGGTAATGTVRYPNGTQNITASVADDTGNTCTSAPVSIVMNSMSCSLDFVTPGPITTNMRGSWLNRVGAGLMAEPADGTPTPTSGTATISVVTSDCGAGKNVYLYAGGASTTPGGSPVVTNASGVATFASQAFAEGSQYTVSIDNGSGRLSHRSFTVSLKAPSVGSIALQRSAQVTTNVPVARNAALIIGAAEGNRRVETAMATDLVFGDLSASTNNAQINLTLANIDGANVGTFEGALDVLEDTTPLMPTVTTGGAPFTPALPVLTLGHRLDDTATTLVIRVTSPAGNTYTSTHSSQVDVIAPAAPTVTRNLTSARAATVELGWGVVYDDGSNAASGGLTGGTQAAGYDIRWTTSSVPLNNSMAAATDYFGSSSKQETVEPWSANAITKSVTLPPINTYFIAVRARDEVGNYSPFVAPSALQNLWTATTVTAPVANSTFAATVIAAPLVGNDSDNDLVVAASGEASIGAVYVYNSTIAATSLTGCGTGCQRLAPSDAVSGAFGVDMNALGNVGDVASENRRDLVVAQTWSASGNAGRVVIFFGTTAATLSAADSIELRGDTNTRVGQTARILKDIDGDGLDELAIAAPLFNSNQGRVFIYKGRSRAAWATLRNATDPATSVPYVQVSTATADWVIDGPTPVLVTPAGNAFGQNRRGLVSTPDFDGDGRPDVAIPTSRGTINRYRVYSSTAIRASSGASPLSASNFRLEISETPTVDNSNTAGVGVATQVGNFVDSNAEDLVTSYPGAGGGGQILIYSAITAPTTPTLNPTVTTRLVGPLTWGQAISLAPVDGDSTSDLLAGTTQATNNTAWLLYQHLAAFETANVGGGPVFFVSKFDAAVISGNANSRLGSVNQLIDVSGDGLADVILGDSIAGEVRIWK
ncbi:MAG: beta strand repeat-containing protein [Archangium sp.]